MKKIDLASNKFALMCVCECIGHDFEKLEKMVDKEGKGYDIEFKVNGEELDFMEIIKLLQVNYDNQVELKAKEIIKNYFDDIQSKAIDICENLDYIKIKTD